MIKANELRIGNLVHEYGIEIKVDAQLLVGLTQIEIANKKCIDITPIPLTEEWLVKFGFEKVTDRERTYSEVMWSVNDFAISNENDGTGYQYAYSVSIEIKYVHQLQNLYFALTGEELTIKEWQ